MKALTPEGEEEEEEEEMQNEKDDGNGACATVSGMSLDSEECSASTSQEEASAGRQAAQSIEPTGRRAGATLSTRQSIKTDKV